MRRVLVSCLLTLAFALPAAADSDGYFCVGPNYLAMEFRSFNTPGLAGPHVLKILRFDEGRAPRWSGEVLVEDFQTHTLICDPTSIRFEGAGDSDKGWLSYAVTLDLAGAPRIASHTSDPATSFFRLTLYRILATGHDQALSPCASKGFRIISNCA